MTTATSGTVVDLPSIVHTSFAGTLYPGELRRPTPADASQIINANEKVER